MRWLAALPFTVGLLIIGAVIVGNSAPFGTSSPHPAAAVGPQVVWEYCFASTADPSITPCPQSGVAPAANNLTSSNAATYVAKINNGAFLSPTGSPTTVTVSLYGASGNVTPLTNVCIGRGGGTKPQDFGATPTIICGTEIGGAPACSSIGSNGVVLPATAFTVNTGQPLIIAMDATASTYTRPAVTPALAAGATPSNVIPAATAITNYNQFFLLGTRQACTTSKNTGYTAIGDNIWYVKKVSVQ